MNHFHFRLFKFFFGTIPYNSIGFILDNLHQLFLFVTGRQCAAEDPDEGHHHPCENKNGTDHSQLHCLKSLLTKANEGNDEANSHSAQTNIQKNVQVGIYTIPARRNRLKIILLAGADSMKINTNCK